LPVFDKPKEDGNFEEKKMMSYGRWGSGNYPMKRERPIKEKTVNLRFFPEGGNLIQGAASRVAFEATDESGNPIEVTGVVINGNQEELSRISTLHEGRGVFTYTPTGAAGRRRDIAEVEYSGKKYRFDMPVGLPQGIVMEVDNLSYPDSIGITLQKNSNTSVEMLGLVVLSGGKLQNAYQIYTEDNEFIFKLDKAQLPLGISQIVLFNGNGEILCDRLIFTGRDDEWLYIKAKTGKATYRPYELVDLEISLADRLANPVSTTFSLSVRDGANEVECNHNILTELLLMSEIKGYVRNPSYYFAGDDEQRRAALDVLLMVQGWRRYSWKQMVGIDSFELKYFPEQGIETLGEVVTFGIRQKPKPEVEVSMLLQKREAGDEKGSLLFEHFVTDHQGRFSFVSDVEGRWGMTLTAAEKGKQKNYWIMLDRVFSPEPKRYRYADLQVNITEKNDEEENIHDETSEDDDFEDDWKSFFVAYQDSLAKLGIDQKVHQIEEVTIKAKRYSKEREILNARTTSVAYYDVPSEYDNLYDSGEYIGKHNIIQLLNNISKDFTLIRGDEIRYKFKRPLFIINYERRDETFLSYRSLRVQAIKSIYINENESVICQYLDPEISRLEALRFISCVVFIETYPDEKALVEEDRGTRKTWLEGYSTVSEFYSPNYMELPPAEPDYRRTLYWNPSVTTDESGKAKIQFYNNSRCMNFSISAETVTSQGKIGIYQP